MNRPREFWQDFRLSIYGPEGLPKNQERECSLAFYAGMLSAFIEVLRISRNNDTDAGAKDIDRLKTEIAVAARHANQTTNNNKGSSK